MIIFKAEINPISGTVNIGMYQYIGYYEQEVIADRRLAMENVWEEFPHATKTEIRRMLAKCGLTNKHIDSTMDVLSGGEQAKVRLCKLLNKKTNILILDEPTNHLDQNAKDELKRAFNEYSGSVIVVSHEPEFYKEIASKVWNCDDWKL